MGPIRSVCGVRSDRRSGDDCDLSFSSSPAALGGLEPLGSSLRVIRKKNGLCGSYAPHLLIHVVAYFGIGYFDQMQFAWYAFLAMVSAVTVVEARSPVTKAALDFVDSSVLPTVRA